LDQYLFVNEKPDTISRKKDNDQSSSLFSGHYLMAAVLHHEGL